MVSLTLHHYTKVIYLLNYKLSLKILHSSVTIISKNQYFIFIQLMMYVVFIINHIHHLMNESKMLIFAYNSDRRVYFF